MKYSKSNPPLVCMMTQSTCYRGTRKMDVLGVLWHSTGANNPNLKRYVQPDDNAPDKQKMLNLIGVNQYKNDMNHINREMGMNAWIGKLADGSVTTIQSMPWDFRPWGCGTGPKGSCNSGWIQFEICEDGLTDKSYFDKVYKEACELTAYLCDMFNIDPHGTVKVNGMDIPTIICHKDSHTFGLGGNHGDIYHWFPKFGKDMDTVRDDVSTLLPRKPVIPTIPTIQVPATEEMYRVRLNWNNTLSQKGAYKNLDSAINLANSLGSEYKVFNSKGEIVYTVVEEDDFSFKVGDEVKLFAGATYTNGKKIPNWVINSKMYIRQVMNNDTYVISTLKTGAITGSVSGKYLAPYEDSIIQEEDKIIEVSPYYAKVMVDVLNVRSKPTVDSGIVVQIKKNQIYTITAECGNWLKLKSGAGWIDENYVKKI